jgi:peroxiredoxin
MSEMIKTKKYKAVVILFFSVLAAATIYLSTRTTNGDEVFINDFRMEGYNSDRFYYNDHYDKNIILVFFTTWCKICKDQLKDFEIFHGTDTDTQIYAVCTDPENSSELSELLNILNLPYQTLLDKNGNFFYREGLKNVPSTIIIKKGRIVYKKEGYSPSHLDTVKSVIEKL